MTKHRWLAGIENLFNNQHRRKQAQRRRAVVATESLETKVLLAADTLGLIQGVVFNDVSDNGLTGEDPRLAAATVQLYRDGGNLSFDNGGADDTLVGSVTTIAGGAFSFPDLAAGRYFVRQQPLAGYMQHSGADVVTVDISPAEALGMPGVLIDDFSLPVGGQTLSANAAGIATASSFSPSVTSIGGERDMTVTATLGSVTFEANGGAFPNNLNYNANFGATGNSTVVWDGADNNATVLSPSGLANSDLTAVGETGFLFSIGSSQAVSLSLIVHSGPANSSTATISLSASAIDTVFVPYSSFVTTTGTGADFSNVGAIEFLTNASVPTTTTVTDLLQSHGPTRFTVDLANFIPMTLGNLVFRDNNNNGLFDSGTETGINGVAMTLFEDTNANNVFDSGIDQQIATTTTAGGGLYSFGNLFPGDYIVRIDSSNFGVAGALLNFQSSTGNGVAPDADVNSTNNDDNGDPLAGAIVSLAVTLTNGVEPTNDGDSDPNTNLSLDFGVFSGVDIVVTKTGTASPIIAGSGVGNLVYTVTASNSGPGAATGLTISDTGVLAANLPPGVTFVSAVGSGSTTFNTTTGVWTIGNLSSGAMASLTVTLTVNASAADNLVVNNTASLLAVNEPDSNSNNNSASVSTDVDRLVDIAVSKSASPATVTAGSGAGNLVFVVTARNNGPSNASGVSILDTNVLAANLPAGVTVVSAVGSGATSFNATTGVWTIGNMTPGGSELLTVTLTAGASVTNNTRITNTASLNAVTEPDSNALNNSQSAFADIIRDVDIVVTKSASVSSVIAGSGVGNLVFTVNAQNSGPSNASGVTLLDTNILNSSLPAGVTFVSAVGSGGSSFNSTSGLWTIGNMASGAAETLTVTLTVGAAAADRQVINNTASLNSVNEVDRILTNNSQSASATVARNVDIQVSKTAVPATVIAGSGTGNLVYTVTAQNNGVSNASGVTISDTDIQAANLPPGVTLVSATGSGGTTYNASTGIWTIGNLAVGSSATLTVTLTVNASASDTLLINNTASLANVNEFDTNSGNNSQNVLTNVDRRVDLAVTKSTTNNPVIAGSGAGNLVYTITTRNNGPSDASGVSLSDNALLIANLPAGVTFVSAVGDGGSTFNQTTGTWTIGNLSASTVRTLTVTVTVGSAAVPQTYNNTVQVTSVNETDTNLNNNTATASTMFNRSVDIQVTKTATAGPVIAGSGAGNLVYTITTRNNGPSDASGVSLSDNALLTANLPAGVTFVSAVGDGGSTFNQTTGTWTIGNLAAAAVRTLTVTVTVGAAAVPQTYNNTVQVTSVNETDTNLNNNTATASTVFNRSVDIQVTKTATAGPVIAGSGAGNLVYTVTARNIGPSNATGVVISDTGILAANLPPGVTFVSATGSNNTTFNPATGLWTVGSLAINGTATLNVVLTVGASASDSLVISNTAVLSTVVETDSNAQNNSQTVTTNVDRSVDIVVTKTANTATVTAGSGVGNLVYTVTASNSGVSDATGVTVADPGVLTANLPTGVTFVSAVGSDGSTFNNVTGIWTVGNLNVGALRTLTITLTVGFTAADGLAINNTATVASVNETESNLNNNSRSATSRVTGYVDLVVVKTGTPDPVLSPGILTYTVLVTNTGTAAATGVVLTDNLGPGMTFSSGTVTQGTVSNANGIVTTSIGTLAAGARATLTLFVSVNVSMDGTLVNTAAATSNQPDRNPNDNTSSIQTRVNLAPTSVSGVVFQDLNRNKTRDAGETLLSGVQIVLFGTDVHGVAVTRQMVTNGNGEYAFTNLVPGRYSVYEIQPGFYIDSDEVAGTGATGTIGADAFLDLRLVQGVNAVAFNFTEGLEDLSKRPFLASSQNAGQTQIVQLPAGGSGSLSGQVATDSNRSNTLDNGDVGIPGVIVTLAGNDSTGNPVLIHQSTDSLGRFSFVKLPAGQYSLLETQPKGKTDGAEQAGTILPDQVLDNLFSAISLPNGGSGTGYNFLELPATAATTATSPTLLTPTTGNVGLRPTISWTPITTATRYDVWVSQIAGNVGVVYRNESVSGTSITLPTDLAFGSHRVWVRSINASGVAGPWSQPLAFNVATQANALQVLSSSMNARATLDWANVPNATSYDLRLINVETGTVLANVTGLPTSQYSGLSTLPPGKYRYFVRGNTAAAAGQWSDGFDYTILSVPTLKSVTGTDSATPTLHWNPVTGATMYEVWLSDLSLTGGSQRVASVDKTNATSIPLPTNLALGDYRYWVRAIDSQGKMTTWSLPSDFKVETAGRILSPSGATNSTTPTFTWNSVPGAIRYDLWVSDKAGKLYVREQNITGTSYTSSKGFINGEYRVWVMPVGATSSGKWSLATKFSVNTIARPTFTAPGANSSSTPTINWTAISNAARYELWVDKVGGASKVIHQTNIAANSHIVTVPLPSGTYRAWVRAFDASGAASVWSLALNFRVV